MAADMAHDTSYGRGQVYMSGPICARACLKKVCVFLYYLIVIKGLKIIIALVKKVIKLVSFVLKIKWVIGGFPPNSLKYPHIF